MTDTITIVGLHYLIGQSVSAFIAGLDCGDYTVDQYGRIAVPVGSDPDGMFSASYLASVSDPGAYGDAEVQIVITDDLGSTTVNVPVVVGLTYTSQGQILRPVAESEIKSRAGPGLAKRKRAHMLGALLHNTAGISFGTDFSNLLPATLRDAAEAALPISATFSGVYWDTLLDSYTFDTMAAWQVSRPYSCVVCQIGPFLASEDE